MIDCMQNQDPLLRLTNVIKRFGKEQAGVGPISLQLFAGEGIALCGQNGAGKSTLLKLMAFTRTDRTDQLCPSGYCTV